MYRQYAFNFWTRITSITYIGDMFMLIVTDIIWHLDADDLLIYSDLYSKFASHICSITVMLKIRIYFHTNFTFHTNVHLCDIHLHVS